MQEDNLAFLQLIRIEDVQLWQVKHNQICFNTRTHLQILYSRSSNLFILRIGDYKWLLNKSLEVIGTTIGTENHPTYLIPNIDGFNILKVVSPNSKVAVANMDTIFDNTTLFMRREGLESSLTTYKGFSEGALNAMSGITKFFSPVEDSHPNQRIIRSWNEIKNVDFPDIPVVDISMEEVHKLQAIGNDISSRHQLTDQWKGFLEAGSSPTKLPSLEENLRSHAGISGRSMSFNPSSLISEKIGCDNIDTRKTHSEKDQQEVVGLENQRLPAYEIYSTKDTVMKGFRKASLNLDPSSNREVISRGQDEEDFTTGLLCGKGPEGSKICSTRISAVPNPDRSNAVRPWEIPLSQLRAQGNIPPQA